MEWGKDTILKLIECYKARTMLWDFKDPDYYNKSAKMLAWEEVGQEMGKDGEECRKKMVSLDSSFRREKSRICRTKRCGKVYESRWFAFKSLSFLYDKGSKKKPPAKPKYYVKRKTSSPTGAISDVKTTIKTEDVNNSNEDESVEYESGSQSPPAENGVSEASDQNRISTGEDNVMYVNESDSYTSDPPEFSNVEVMAEPNRGRICCRTGETDECRSFGIFIGNKLRNYSQSTRNMVQHAISNIVFSADQGHFDARGTNSTFGYTTCT